MATRGVNKVILLGNVGKDPEVKNVNNMTICSISIATSEEWKDKNSGAMEKRTEWHNVTFFNKLADIAARYLKKGSKIYVEGSLRTNKYDKNGQTHYATSVIANTMQMLDSKSDSQQSNQKSKQSYNAVKDGSVSYDHSSNDFDDDLPF